jgi:uncharacterized protein
MIAVDTNILVYAHIGAMQRHARAAAVLGELGRSRAAWAIAWPCIHEFIAVVTNPRAFDPCLEVDEAIDAVRALQGAPGLRLIGEGPGHRDILARLLKRGGARGGAVHDARIASICLAHEVGEIWTVDRDFLRFPGLRVRNPLVD